MIGFPSLVKSISASLVVIITNNLLKQIGGDSALGVFAIVNRLYSALNMPQRGVCRGCSRWWATTSARSTSTGYEPPPMSLSTTAVYGPLVCGICLLMPATLIGLLSKEPVIIVEGPTALRLWRWPPLGGISVTVAAYFQAVGRAKAALLLTLGSIILVKLPVLLLAAGLFSLTGIWAAEAASEFMLCTVSLLLLRSYQEKMAPAERLAYSP